MRGRILLVLIGTLCAFLAGFVGGSAQRDSIDLLVNCNAGYGYLHRDSEKNSLHVGGNFSWFIVLEFNEYEEYVLTNSHIVLKAAHQTLPTSTPYLNAREIQWQCFEDYEQAHTYVQERAYVLSQKDIPTTTEDLKVTEFGDAEVPSFIPIPPITPMPVIITVTPSA